MRKATAKVGPSQRPLMPKSLLKAKYQLIDIPQMKYPIKFKIVAIPCLSAARITALPMICIVSKNVKQRRTGQADRMSFAIGS